MKRDLQEFNVQGFDLFFSDLVIFKFKRQLALDLVSLFKCCQGCDLVGFAWFYNFDRALEVAVGHPCHLEEWTGWPYLVQEET